MIKVALEEGGGRSEMHMNKEQVMVVVGIPRVGGD